MTSKIWTGPSSGDPKPIIYLGGITGGVCRQPAWYTYPKLVRFECLSYYYLDPIRHKVELCQKLITDLTKQGTRCFLDSGAFSYQMDAKKRKYVLDKKSATAIINQYCDWVHQCPFNFDFIVTFDYQRDAGIEAWATKQIEARGLHPVPTYHYGSPLTALRQLIDRGYSLIGIGGMVGTSARRLVPFLDQVFNITEPASVRCHGFGIGSAVLTFKYPFFSVDSTTWVMKIARGEVLRRSKDPRKIVEDVTVSSRTSHISHKDGDNRIERIRETWETYNDLMRNPPIIKPTKRGLF